MKSSLEMYWSPRFCAILSVRLSSFAEVVRDVHLAARALDLRQPVEGLAEPRAQQVDLGARLLEQRPHRAALLVEQRQHQVRGLDELVVAAEGQRLGVGQGHLELGGQFVHAHGGGSGKGVG